MEIRAVCFDLGKVLLHFDWGIMFERIARQSPLAPGELRRRFEQHGSIPEYETGRITTEQFLAGFRELFEFTGTTLALNTYFCEIFTPIEENIALAQSLVPHYPVGILSNTSESHIAYAEATYPFLRQIPVRIYSYAVGLMKPDRAIYEKARTRLGGFPPEENLYIDDVEANVAGAIAAGWQAIQVPPGTDLRAALVPYRLKGL